MRPAFFAFDVETTGLDPLVHEIISIAIVLLDEAFNPIKDKVIYAFPDKGITAEAQAVNGYTIEQWVERGAGSQEVLFAEIYAFVKGHKRLLATGHNVKFDLAFLRELFIRNETEDQFNQIFSYHALDTVGAALLFDMVKFGKKNNTYKLENLCERFGISIEGAHDAKVDINATINLFKYLVTALGGSGKLASAVPPPDTSSRLILRKGDHWIFSGGKHKNKTIEDIAKTEPDYLGWVLDNVSELSSEQKTILSNARDAKKPSPTFQNKKSKEIGGGESKVS
jgi:DNA polymerase III epsilon subunit-like protein